MGVTLIVLFLVSVTNAQDVIFELESDTCTLRNGGYGICKASRLCPEAYENFPRERPVICGFVGRHPNVCCPVKIDRVTGKPDVIVPILDTSPPDVDFKCGDSKPTAVFDFGPSFQPEDFPAPSPLGALQPPGIIGTPLSSPSRESFSRSSLHSTSGNPGTPSGTVGTSIFTPFVNDTFENNEEWEQTFESVGGLPARFVLVKYSVIAGSRDPSGNTDWFCTGVLLNHQWVLTAAHCVNARLITVVRLGEHDYNDPDDGAFPQDYDVIEAILYPDFSHPQGYHDLALLKLASHVTFGSFINPVCLPWGIASQKDLTNLKISLTGWGATEFGGSLSSILQEVNVTIFSNSICERSYSELRNYNIVWPRGITNDIICAGDPEGGKDACQGDSGGPVVYLNEVGQYVLAGVVSRGYGCGLKDFPGLYANIHHEPYLAWIKRVAFQ